MPRDCLYVRNFLLRLRNDKDGVVSLEYVIVAACIVTTVVLAFGAPATSPIGTAVAGALGSIASKVTTAVSAA